MKIDDLFFGARNKLKEAQSELHQLLELIQDGNHGVDASDVADCVKAVAKSISEMDSLADDWQQKANQAKTKMGENVVIEDHLLNERLYTNTPKTITEIGTDMQFNFNKFFGEDE